MATLHGSPSRDVECPSCRAPAGFVAHETATATRYICPMCEHVWNIVPVQPPAPRILIGCPKCHRRAAFATMGPQSERTYRCADCNHVWQMPEHVQDSLDD